MKNLREYLFEVYPSQMEGIEPKDVVFHSCRHTYGTLLALRGVNPLAIMNAMGHTNFNTTQKYIKAAGIDVVSQVHEKSTGTNGFGS